jgi:predicted DNA-binding ribbon-helix-helix protein
VEKKESVATHGHSTSVVQDIKLWPALKSLGRATSNM